MANLFKPSHNASHSLLVCPNIRFEIQRPGESVILVVRRHPLTQIPWIFNAIVLTLVLIALNFFIPNFLTPNQVLVFNLFIGIFIFAYTWLNFLLWYFTVGIVTNERILDLDFYNILYKEFTATVITQISELTTKVGGFFGSIFDFGTVFIKTEGFEQNIEFQEIPEPSTVVKIINELKLNT